MRGWWNPSEACSVIEICGGAFCWGSFWLGCWQAAVWAVEAVAARPGVALPFCIGKAGRTGVWARRLSRATEAKLASGQYPPCNDTGGTGGRPEDVDVYRIPGVAPSEAVQTDGFVFVRNPSRLQQRYRCSFTRRSARAKPAARLSLFGAGLTRSTGRSSMATSASHRIAWSCSSDVGLPDFVAPRSSRGFPTRPMAY